MNDIFLGYPPPKIRQFIEEHYTDQMKIPLNFTAEEAGSTVGLKLVRGDNDPLTYSFEYSRDNKTWTNYNIINNYTGEILTLENIGDKIYFRATDTNLTMGDGVEGSRFVMTGKLAANGNIMSLLDKTMTKNDLTNEYDGQGTFRGLFFNCSSLTKAPKLPWTTLATNCYIQMFYGCSSLTQAPELPATTLAEWCYALMFQDCTSLSQAPELPATTLAYACYTQMFRNSGISEFTVDMTACTSVPSLPESYLFSSSNKPYTVLVPASLYNDWIQATNWSAIASNIKAV